MFVVGNRKEGETVMGRRISSSLQVQSFKLSSQRIFQKSFCNIMLRHGLDKEASRNQPELYLFLENVYSVHQSFKTDGKE